VSSRTARLHRETLSQKQNKTKQNKTKQKTKQENILNVNKVSNKKRGVLVVGWNILWVYLHVWYTWS
jgi:methionine-rich copper-binding protein CopC